MHKIHVFSTQLDKTISEKTFCYLCLHKIWISLNFHAIFGWKLHENSLKTQLHLKNTSLSKIMSPHYSALMYCTKSTWTAQFGKGGYTTDKRTDVILWKINSGLWSGQDWEIKGSGPIMSNLWGPFFHFFGVKNFFLNFFENTIASALKSCIILFLQFLIFLIFWTRKSEKNGLFRAKIWV